MNKELKANHERLSKDAEKQLAASQKENRKMRQKSEEMLNSKAKEQQMLLKNTNEKIRHQEKAQKDKISKNLEGQKSILNRHPA